MLGGLWRSYQVMDLRRRGRMLLLVSLIMGALAGWMVHLRIKDLESQFGDRISVFVAARDIPPHTPIRPDMLATREVPIRHRLAGLIAVGQEEDLIGWASLVPIQAGHVVTRNVLSSHGLGAADNRTYTLTSSPKIVVGELAQGDRIDVLAVYRLDDQDRSEIGLSDIPVLSVSEAGRDVRVTLAVTPEQAARLAWYENFGHQVRLLRRG